jgi:hypothetical protein
VEATEYGRPAFSSLCSLLSALCCLLSFVWWLVLDDPEFREWRVESSVLLLETASRAWVKGVVTAW